MDSASINMKYLAFKLNLNTYKYTVFQYKLLIIYTLYEKCIFKRCLLIFWGIIS